MHFSNTLLSLFSIVFIATTFVSAKPMFGEHGDVWVKGTRQIARHARLAKRASPSPHWVTYWDSWINGEHGPPDPSVLKGFNVLNLAFLLASGPADQVVQWTSLDASTRSSIKSKYAAAGIKLMVSVFGATDAPTSNGHDPVSTANSMANFVKKYSLDGIDVDYEDFTAINAQDGKAEAWLITFTQTLRAALPTGQYTITHAPVAPWFSPIYSSGAYTKVHTTVGSLIDWYNIQFYNQDEYTTCDGLLTQSSKNFPKSSVFEIAQSAGVPLEKIVIGKPAIASDADNGYIALNILAACVATAKAKGWTGGVMTWEYPHADAAWIASVRAQSWPVGSSSPPTGSSITTTSSTSTSVTTSTLASTTTKLTVVTTKVATSTALVTSTQVTTTSAPFPSLSSGTCSGVDAWVSGTIYVGGQSATSAGYLWKAKWWTQGNIPGALDHWNDPWTQGVAC